MLSTLLKFSRHDMRSILSSSTLTSTASSSSSSSASAAAAAATTRDNVISMYRRMLILCRSLPDTTRTDNINKIRMEFRSASDVMDPDSVQELIKKANSTIGYLKIITPRTSRRKDDVQQGTTTIVFGEGGKLGPKAVTNWHGGNMDPDSVKRHYQGLKRAGFKSNSDAKGIF